MKESTRLRKEAEKAKKLRDQLYDLGPPPRMPSFAECAYDEEMKSAHRMASGGSHRVTPAGQKPT